MSKSDNQTVDYNSTNQPADLKNIAAFEAALLFSFNLFFFGPVDIYLTNIRDMTISSSCVIIPAAVICLISSAVFFLILSRLKGKAHILAMNILTGLSLALYVQGNYLHMSSGVLDGSKISLNVGFCIIDLLIWAVCICVPYLFYRYFNDLYLKMIGFLTLLICVMEITAMVATVYSITANDDTGILNDALVNQTTPFVHSQENKYNFSSDHNFIVILADEYDSFCFDSSLEEEPESAGSLKDFTYYKDTVGMYGYSSAAIDHIFSGRYLGDEEYPTRFFDSLQSNDYNVEFFITNNDVLPQNISSQYADNFQEYDINFRDLLRMDMCIYKLVGYKYSPEILKPLFYMTNSEISELMSAAESYYPDDLTFYNSIPDTGTVCEEKQFKFYYIYGLHDPRNITRDLERAPDWSVSGEEQAIAVNKILSAYIEMLKKTGVYDNSDIVILADHGIKNHDSGKYPLLMIKRAGETHDELNISDVRVSYDDVFPTLVCLAGGQPEKKTVFELTSDDNERRYFDSTGEYISGNIK